jgi:hypothetical protein
MAIIADFMLVWLPAPTLALAPRGGAASLGLFGRVFAGCPDNAFQKVPSGMEPFTLAQRLGAPVRNGMKLFAVGIGARCARARGAFASRGKGRYKKPVAVFVSLLDRCSSSATTPTIKRQRQRQQNKTNQQQHSFVGVAVTNTLVALRKALDPAFAPLNAPQNVLATSAAYGLYMSTSSNLRYQLLAGVIEERGIETVFKGQHTLCAALSFVVRTANTFVGSLLWVDFVRLLGMQKAGGEDDAKKACCAGGKKGGKKDDKKKK